MIHHCCNCFFFFLVRRKRKIDTKLETSPTTFYPTTLFCILPRLPQPRPKLQKFQCGCLTESLFVAKILKASCLSVKIFADKYSNFLNACL